MLWGVFSVRGAFDGGADSGLPSFGNPLNICTVAHYDEKSDRTEGGKLAVGGADKERTQRGSERSDYRSE